MTNEKYKTLLNKIQGESKKIRLEPSDEIIEIKANVFSFYEQYLQNIQNYNFEEQTILKDSLNAITQRLGLAKDYIKLNYIKKLREDTSLEKDIIKSLENIGFDTNIKNDN
jgi:hypothetical protein